MHSVYDVVMCLHVYLVFCLDRRNHVFVLYYKISKKRIEIEGVLHASSHFYIYISAYLC
jgi:hypothetical protein